MASARITTASSSRGGGGMGSANGSTGTASPPSAAASTSGDGNSGGSSAPVAAPTAFLTAYTTNNRATAAASAAAPPATAGAAPSASATAAAAAAAAAATVAAMGRPPAAATPLPPLQLYVIPNGDRVGILVVGPATALLWPPHDSFLATERMTMHTMAEPLDAAGSQVRLYGALPRQDAVGPVYLYIASIAPTGQHVVLRRTFLGMLPPSFPSGIAGYDPAAGLYSGGNGLGGGYDGAHGQPASMGSSLMSMQLSASMRSATGSHESINGFGSSDVGIGGSASYRPALPNLANFQSHPGPLRTAHEAAAANAAGVRRPAATYAGRDVRGSNGGGESARGSAKRRAVSSAAAAAAATASTASGAGSRGSDRSGLFREQCGLWCQGWSPDEQACGRRLIRFWTHPSTREVCACPASVVPEADTPMASTTVISVIYWNRLDDFFITGCDFFRLMEGLAAEPFDKERRSRIRRLLEPFTGRTVHQGDANVQEFFAQVMAYGPPKPRTAVKDFKVYPWRQLEQAVNKVMHWDRNPKRRYNLPDPSAPAGGQQVRRPGGGNGLASHGGSGSTTTTTAYTHSQSAGAADGDELNLDHSGPENGD